MKNNRRKNLVLSLTIGCFFWLGAQFSVFGWAAGVSDTNSSRYTMGYGKGWSVCESYLKFLNSTRTSEKPPICDLKLNRVPDFQELPWEVLDVQQNLKLIHQIELILGIGRIEPKPDSDFERWKLQFQQRLQMQSQRPRLRRARLVLTPAEMGKTSSPVTSSKSKQNGRMETLLAYDPNPAECGAGLKKAMQGQPNILSGGSDQTSIFIFDEESKRVKGNSTYAIEIQGEWVLHKGRPYYIQRIIGDAAGVRHGSIDRGGHLYINRVEENSNPLPGDPPYIRHDLCRIRFDYPISLR